MPVLRVRTAEIRVRRLGEGLVGEGVRAARREAHRVHRRPRPDRRPMRHRQVVALHEVLGEQFPIGLPDMILVQDRHIARNVVAADDVFEGSEELCQRFGLGIQSHIDPALPDFCADLWKTDVCMVEGRRTFHMWRPDQSPADIVGPLLAHGEHDDHVIGPISIELDGLALGGPGRDAGRVP